LTNGDFGYFRQLNHTRVTWSPGALGCLTK
jgi:hypothetical protein